MRVRSTWKGAPERFGSEVLLCWVGSRFQHPTNLCSTLVPTRRPGSFRTDCQKVSSRTVKVCCDGLARVFSKLRHGVASVGNVGLARHCVSERHDALLRRLALCFFYSAASCQEPKHIRRRALLRSQPLDAAPFFAPSSLQAFLKYFTHFAAQVWGRPDFTSRRTREM